jgi:hypothetical protein
MRSEQFEKLVNAKASLVQDRSESSDPKGLMTGHANASKRSFPPENDMAPTLPLNDKTYSLQRFDEVVPGRSVGSLVILHWR